MARLRDQMPDMRIIDRDLGAAPVPHFDADSMAVMNGSPANTVQKAALALSDQLIAEVKAADILLIGAPLYNFGIASSLKS